MESASTRRPTCCPAVDRGVLGDERGALPGGPGDVMASVTAPSTAVPGAGTGSPRAPTPAARRRGRARRTRRDYLTFVAFAAPNLLLIVMFTYRPLLSNIYYSTLNWTLGAKVATPVG